MDNENGRPFEPDEMPGELKTVNQIVAWNIAYYRRAAGMTQEVLGLLLKGRSKANISADERSWDSGRTREFDAQTLISLSLALRVPLNAFFLPPPDDGNGVRYLFRPATAGRDLDMGHLMAAILSDSKDDGEAMCAYRRRLIDAVGYYLDEGWQSEVASWLRPLVGAEALEEGALRLRGQREQLLASAAWLGEMADALEQAGTGEEASTG